MYRVYLTRKHRIKCSFVAANDTDLIAWLTCGVSVSRIERIG